MALCEPRGQGPSGAGFTGFAGLPSRGLRAGEQAEQLRDEDGDEFLIIQRRKPKAPLLLAFPVTENDVELTPLRLGDT